MSRVNQSCVTVLTATSVEDALWTMYYEVLSSLLFDVQRVCSSAIIGCSCIIGVTPDFMVSGASQV